MAVLGGGGVAYERGTPVEISSLSHIILLLVSPYTHPLKTHAPRSVEQALKYPPSLLRNGGVFCAGTFPTLDACLGGGSALSKYLKYPLPYTWRNPASPTRPSREGSFM